jgi:transcription termination factor NusB
VTLDEAVELTKSFCIDAAAVGFVNGILGNIHKHLLQLKDDLVSE